MANYNDPVEQNIEGVRQLIGSRVNKTNDNVASGTEGPDAEHVDQFTLKLSDEELIRLASAWENKYASYETDIKKRQEAQKTYYLGKQKNTSPLAYEEPISANLLFEAEETFLPAALSKNPEPVVYADNTPEGNELSKTVRTMLQYHADTLVLRRKLTLVTRHWSIYFLGVMKHGFDPRINDIKSDVIDPQKIILDPDSTIDPYGDSDSTYIGERKTVTARALAELFPDHREWIIASVDGRMGTMTTYTEWWSDDFVFFTYKKKVLGKHKNPHYNYEQAVTQEDEYGNIVTVVEQGPNHFAFPKKPYTFLSVFSLGEQPHDITGLIEQNIPNQRRITRRTEQIDMNLSRSNNSDVFSEENFNQETAKQAAKALAQGHPVLVPQGKSIAEAIQRLQGVSVDGAFFTELEVSKNDLRSIFGTQGITAEAGDEDQTARGMILNQGHDTTRIGGGIGDAIEQFADNVFNWWVQLYAVYYDQPHFASIMGAMKAVEYTLLKGSDLNRRIVVSVAPDSMKPRDEVNEINTATQLYQNDLLDPKTYFTVTNFANPEETAGQVTLWKTNPALYFQVNFPDLFAQLQQQAQQQALLAAQGAAPPIPNGGEAAPESMTEPQGSLSSPGTNASLSNVPLTTPTQ